LAKLDSQEYKKRKLDPSLKSMDQQQLQEKVQKDIHKYVKTFKRKALRTLDWRDVLEIQWRSIGDS
jgi:hypothetical protein